MTVVRFLNNKYFYTTVILFLILLIFEDTTLFRLYEMKKELNEISVQNELKSIEIEQVKEKTLQLTTNKEALEKFAREHYLMKKKDEVIYVFDDL
ncbi:MAG: septum formation initiator family protein [Bacteroidota bacterium]|nr:septum formation initiator family protein [Bacteroidota bacterium]